MLPPLLIVITLGTLGFFSSLRRKAVNRIAFFILLPFYILNFALYLHRYYVHWPLESEEWWHSGFEESFSWVKENESSFDKIVFSDHGEPPLIFALFWLKVNPKILQNSKMEWVKVNDSIMADHLPGTKYYFGCVSREQMRLNGLVGTLSPEILYVMLEIEVGLDYRYHNVPPTIRLLETIYYPSGRVAKYILTGTK